VPYFHIEKKAKYLQNISGKWNLADENFSQKENFCHNMDLINRISNVLKFYLYFIFLL